MTPGRRPLSFDNFDQIMPDVERLLGGCSTVGNWSLALICRHLSAALRGTADLPATTPQDPSLWISEELRRQIFESGQLLEGYAAPPAMVPEDAPCKKSAAEGLRQSIAYYRASDGPLIPHLYIGPLTKVGWDRFHLIHAAHHLSFVIPNA
jgi:hypothetical protein